MTRSCSNPPELWGLPEPSIYRQLRAWPRKESGVVQSMVVAIVTFGILVTCLYVLTGVWLEKHAEARRWRVWLMDTFFCAIVMGAIFTLLQPFDLLVVGLGVILGAVVG